MNIYIDLIRDNNNEESWSSVLNCQTFVRNLIEHLNLNYPSNIVHCSDLPPAIVDFTILCLRTSAHSKQKLSSSKANSNDSNKTD